MLDTSLALWTSELPSLDRLNRTARVLQFDVPTREYASFRYIMKEFGFDYEARSTSVYLSIAVSLLYCTMLSGYVLYILVTGSVSTAWTSGVQLVILALR